MRPGSTETVREMVSPPFLVYSLPFCNVQCLYKTTSLSPIQGQRTEFLHNDCIDVSLKHKRMTSYSR